MHYVVAKRRSGGVVEVVGEYATAGEAEAAVERFMRTQRLDGSFEVGGVKYRDARQAEADSPEAAVAWYRSEGGPRRS